MKPLKKENKSLEPYKKYQVDLLEFWINELGTNPKFNEISAHAKEHLKSTTQSFLNNIDTQLSENGISNKESLSKALKFWHSMLKQHQQKGFTLKDSALLIFSLKTAFNSFIATHKSIASEDLFRLHELLDVLGLLTFELYTAEKEYLIGNKESQIQYLQSTKFETNKKLIGNSREMQAVLKACGLILENDISVLLEGESGTGKDLIANLIHQNSKRKKGPFIVVNCGAIPKELMESELFGHEKSAFTGADDKKIGKFELAQDGTLFLDEIGELPLDMQVKLLRALQNKEIERVGGVQKITVNIRIIAATNKSLKQLVKENKFRLDLYYRLNVYPISVPSLKERKDDILPLAQYFLDLYADKFNVDKKRIDPNASTYLLNQEWEGNIRELENLMQRAVILAQSPVITEEILRLKPGKLDFSTNLLNPASKEINELPEKNHEIKALDQVEKEALIKAILFTEGNIRSASQQLGISRTTFYNKLNKYNIDLETLLSKNS